jgi:hemolysin activation/secretion protein
MKVDLKWITMSISSLATYTCLTLNTLAQSPPPPGITLPPETPETIEQILPQPPASPLPSEPPTPPPQPELQTPQPQAPPDITSPSSNRIFIKTVEVLGNTVLHQEIAALITPFQNREASFEDLLNLRSDITQLYLKNGYITSGAFLLNNQELSQGEVQIQVVEGELEQIEITGLNRLRESYVRSRLQLATTPPLNQKRLETALQLLQLDPLLQQVNAELTAGSTPGRNSLRVQLKEAPAFHAAIATANNQSPSLGSVQNSVNASYDNVLGFGDRFSAEYGITAGLNLYDLNYTIPINARNGTLSLRYGNTDSRIIEEAFEDLDIRSESRTFSVNFRQPLIRTPERELGIGLALDLRRSQTYILDDIPFSFSEGPDNGESNVTVIRFYQDWVNRNAKRVLAVRSQFSFGIDAFDATINDIGTDGRFFSWLGQFQWVEQLSPRALLVTRINAQLTPDSLLSLERFSIGGVDTVRGYAHNQRVGDNGIVGTVEVRLPLTSNPRILQLSPFFEIGTVWNNRDANPETATIAGLGLGLNWLISPDLSLRLDYGIPLIEVDDEGDSLQDNGLYFSLRYQPF